MIAFGVDRIVRYPELAADWGRCGLLSNQASVTENLQPSWQALRDVIGDRLTTLFGPQHGMEAVVQDNMIETDHSRHPETGLPLYSLYSEARIPTETMLAEVDTLVVDLQNVGCRVYTFKQTVGYCLAACAKLGKRVVILDRPNPMGGKLVEGRVLDKAARSFVGEYAIPMRHGLTLGEFATFLNASLGLGCELEVIRLEGWDARQSWEATHRPWIPTSPNVPSLATVLFFAGTVGFEGTNVSEGRGTTLPFQLIGAPYVDDPYEIVARVRDFGVVHENVFLRPAVFQPCFHKWAGEACRGVHLVNRTSSIADTPVFALGLALLRSLIEAGRERFAWKDPGYEYDFERNPADLILGSTAAHELLTRDTFHPKDAFWHEGIAEYIERVRSSLLYERNMQPT